ncbi:MAG: DUF2723 domain-containing protein [Anaerolineae bacterium]
MLDTAASPSSSPSNQPGFRWQRADLLMALGIMLLALVIYTRVLAPDMLYGDSGEFQTLAYEGGMTHTTGYPVYLLFARLVGFLPVGTLAWRINFASAVAAAITLGNLYLITRHFTGRGGSLFASFALLISYTFWSQSIIAEVYTPALAVISLLLLLLLRWQAVTRRVWLLFLSGVILTLGVGVHLFVLLFAPSIGLFVLWGIVTGLPPERGQWKNLLVLAAGAVAGLLAFYALFAFYDSRPTPTSIFDTTMYPSRDAWHLTEADLDSLPERFWLSVTGYQWRDRMLPNDVDYGKTITIFFRTDLAREFATPTLWLAVFGLPSAAFSRRRLFALTGSALVVTYAAGLVYFPGDKYLFYLPFYLLLALFAGIGAGTLLSGIARFMPKVIPRFVPAMIVTGILLALCAAPYFPSRWHSLELGRSGFITEDYVYPVSRGSEPRAAAECALSKTPEAHAFLVMDWRALFDIYYLARVEGRRPEILIREALPYPTKVVTASLLAEIDQRLASGQAAG